MTLKEAVELHAEALRGLRKAEAARDTAIRQAAGEGSSLRRIAEQAGVSHQRVAQIINKEKT